MKHHFRRGVCALLAAAFLLLQPFGALRAEAVFLPEIPNTNRTLSVPTQVKMIGKTCFLVDCYHNRVLYSGSPFTILTDWKVLDYEYKHPHDIAGDGEILMVADTDNDRIITYEQEKGGYNRLQTIETGVRPHAVTFDEETGLFYVWSSMTGEMYRYKRTEGTHRVELQDVQQVADLKDCYTRSFTILDGNIYLPSMGRSAIYVVDKDSFRVKKIYPVPTEVGGMVQLSRIGKCWYLTYSSDQAYDQSKHGLLRAASLEDLQKGKWEELDRYLDGNAPYTISGIGEQYFVTVTGCDEMPSGIYTFEVVENNLVNCSKIIQ